MAVVVIGVDPHKASHTAVAIAALRSASRRVAAADDHAAVLRVWSKRRRDLGRARTQVVCRLHAVLCELVPAVSPCGFHRGCTPASRCPGSKGVSGGRVMWWLARARAPAGGRVHGGTHGRGGASGAPVVAPRRRAVAGAIGTVSQLGLRPPPDPRPGAACLAAVLYPGKPRALQPDGRCSDGGRSVISSRNGEHDAHTGRRGKVRRGSDRGGGGPGRPAGSCAA
jgi:hypothetical protein